MIPIRYILLSLTLTLWTAHALAASTDFSGHWQIDLRTPAEHQQKVDCGNAYFTLTQIHDRITGDHGFATPGCGQLNEGGDGTVKGVVIGSTAVLVVTSGRNGAIVLGEATRHGNKLHWVTFESIKPGEPEADSPLILGEGVLSLEKSRSNGK